MTTGSPERIKGTSLATSNNWQLNSMNGDQSLYYVAFGLYAAAFFLSVTTFPALSLERTIKTMSILLLTIKLARQRFSLKSAVATLAILSIGLASWWVTSDVKILTLSLFIMASEGIDVKTLAKIIIAEYAILIAITAAFAYFGVIDSRESVRVDTGKLRSSMGFTHPNRFGSMIFAVVSANTIRTYPHFSLSHIVACAMGLLTIYYVCDSRSALFMTALVTFLAFFCGKASLAGHGKKLAAGAAICFILLALVSVYCTINYNSSVAWMHTLDEVLGHRLVWAHRYYIACPATPMGRPSAMATLQVDGKDLLMIDNSFSRLLILFGIIPLCIFVAAHLLRFRKSFMVGMFTAADFGLLICAIAGLTEHNAMLIAMNFCLVALYPWHMSGYERDARAPAEAMLAEKHRDIGRTRRGNRNINNAIITNACRCAHKDSNDRSQPA